MPYYLLLAYIIQVVLIQESATLQKFDERQEARLWWVVLGLDYKRERETKAEGKRLKMANVDFRISQRSSVKNPVWQFESARL